MGFRFSMNGDRTLWDGVSIVVNLGLLSGRNLSNIAHTRDCTARELTESGLRSFRSTACLSDVIGAFL